MVSQSMSDEEIVRTGTEIYRQHLRQQLEPALNGSENAICVEDGDYEVAESIAEADRRLRVRHPDAVFFYGRVGGDHAVHWGSAAGHVTVGKH